MVTVTTKEHYVSLLTIMQQSSFILTMIATALNAVKIDVPPVGVLFQIKNKGTSKCMSITENDCEFCDELGSYECLEGSNNQLWTVYRQLGDHEWFMLRNQNSGRCVYSNDAWDHIFDHECHPEYEEQWFRISQSKVPHAPEHTFKLQSKSSGKYLYSAGDALLGHKDCNCENDIKWKFEFEPYTIWNVKFDTRKAEILHKRQMIIGSAICNNQYGSNRSQVQLSVEKQLLETSSFEFKAGFDIAFGEKGKARIPCVTDGEVRVNGTDEMEFTWGEEQSRRRTYNAVFNVNAAPGEIVEGVVTVNVAEIEMPYKITLLTIGGGVRITSEGIWKGQTSWDLSFETRTLDGVPKRRRIAPLERKVKR
eukprot:144903_1